VYEVVPPWLVGTDTMVFSPSDVFSITDVTVLIKGAVVIYLWITVSPLVRYEVVVVGAFGETLVGVMVLGAVTVELVTPLLLTV